MAFSGELPLDEVPYFDVVTHNPSTGARASADSTPTFDVFEEATDTAILAAQSMTLRASATGIYRGTFTASAANGFEVGKWYSVVSYATVNGVTAQNVAMGFRLVAAETTAGKPDVTVAAVIAGALANFFTTDSGTTYASAVAGSVVKEIASNAGGGTPPTAAAIATAVWQDATAGDFTTASSIGKALYVSNVAPGGSGGHMISGSNSGTTTLAALTVTGATTHTGNVLLSDGLTIAAPSTVDRAGITVTGNGAGAGIISTGGATGDGVKAVGGASGHGLTAQGTGTTKHGVNAVGGTTTSAGIAATGGATSGDGMLISAGASGHGINTAGVGTTKHGITAAGGSTTSHGINALGGGVGHGILATSGGGATGDGIKGVSVATAGNGLNLLGNGTGNGLLATGGAGAGGDGIEAAAGGGVDMRANQTGNLVGTVSTLTTYTGNTPQTGDVYALANGVSGFVATKTDTAAIKLKTDSLTFTGAGKVDASVRDWVGDTIPARNVTGVPKVDITHLLGTAWLTPGTAGTPDVNVKLWNALTTVELPLVPTTAGRKLDVSAGGEAGLDWANVGSPTSTVGLTNTTVGVLTTYTGNTPQTGDSFARIGVAGVGLTNVVLPSGGLANVTAWTVALTGNITGNLSGSVGSVTGLTASDVGAIKTKTDSLAFTVPGYADVNIQYVNDVQVNGVGTAGNPWGP